MEYWIIESEFSKRVGQPRLFNVAARMAVAEVVYNDRTDYSLVKRKPGCTYNNKPVYIAYKKGSNKKNWNEVVVGRTKNHPVNAIEIPDTLLWVSVVDEGGLE